MNAELIQAYGKARKDGMNARNALAIARHKQTVSNLPYVVEDRTKFKHKGFDVKIRVEPDCDVDLSWLGTFTDRPDGFAFDRSRIQRYSARNDCKYFEPAADNGRSVKEYRQGYHAIGYSKHDAYTQAMADLRSDWKMAEELEDNGQYGVIVEVSRAGVKLGSASIWSIDSEWIEGAYLEYGLLDEAISEARKTLRALCPGKRKAV